MRGVSHEENFKVPEYCDSVHFNMVALSSFGLSCWSPNSRLTLGRA